MVGWGGVALFDQNGVTSDGLREIFTFYSYKCKLTIKICLGWKIFIKFLTRHGYIESTRSHEILYRKDKYTDTHI